MTDQAKKHSIILNIDLIDSLAGFKSASKPTAAHHKIMKHYTTPLLLGPSPSDMLMDLILHMFTDEEAELVACLPPLWPRSAAKVAKLAGRSVEDATRILNDLSFNKKVVLASGNPRKYTILPIVPGTFEMALMTADPSTFTSWHKKFSELFEKLWETRYFVDYPGNIAKAPVRYLPVDSVVKNLNMTWPSDRLEEIFEPYKLFAVGHCQCRIAMQLVGKGCGKPTENCLSFGPLAKPLIERGMMRKIDKAEAIAIKHQAELEGCITWMMNVSGDWRGNSSCSCCGCCCHYLRSITEMSVPGLITQPHFKPEWNEDSCTLCQACVEACHMGAWKVIGDKLSFDQSRCIGCGLCAVACEYNSMEMKPVGSASPPTKSWRGMTLAMTPLYLSNTVRVWTKRLFGI